jgi:NAD(P)-dependent dehydrogenase (short-subunit alcohol dehydrogenase family)
MIIQIGGSNYLFDELKKNNKVLRFSRSTENYFDINDLNTWKEFEESAEKNNKFCITVGILQKKRIIDQSREEIVNSFLTNCISIVLLCERIFSINDEARVVIVSSESGSKGSYDETYFLSKAAINKYVEERSVLAKQQLVCISPSTIEDSTMTKVRDDKARLESYKSSHPKKRFMKMQELANLISFLFEDSSHYICNENININGGKFARMKNF